MKMILAAIFLFSMPSFATSYCYDSARGGAQSMKRELNECGVNKFDNELDQLFDSLGKPGPQKEYAYGVLLAMYPLFSIFHTYLPYDKDTMNNECVQNQVKQWKNLQLRVMSAIALCYH